MDSVIFKSVEMFTQCITYVMIVSGIPSCIHMLRTKRTKGVPYPFFLAATVNSVMGIGYGFLVDNVTLVRINVIASSFNVFYVGSFIWASSGKLRPCAQFTSCIGFMSLVYLYVTRITSADHVIGNIGVILLLCSIILLLTPLLQVKQCIQDKCASSISLIMMTAGFLCSISWFLYGYLLQDFYIYGPNLLGILSYTCQVGVIAVFGHKQQKTVKSR